MVELFSFGGWGCNHETHPLIVFRNLSQLSFAISSKKVLRCDKNSTPWQLLQPFSGSEQTPCKSRRPTGKPCANCPCYPRTQPCTRTNEEACDRKVSLRSRVTKTVNPWLIYRYHGRNGAMYTDIESHDWRNTFAAIIMNRFIFCSLRPQTGCRYIRVFSSPVYQQSPNTGNIGSTALGRSSR